MQFSIANADRPFSVLISIFRLDTFYKSRAALSKIIKVKICFISKHGYPLLRFFNNYTRDFAIVNYFFEIF